MTRGGDFIGGDKCKKNHSSAMLNSAWCDLNSEADFV